PALRPTEAGRESPDPALRPTEGQVGRGSPDPALRPTEGLPTPTLSALRDGAESVLARLAQAAARRTELTQSAGELQRQRAGTPARARPAEERLGAWRVAWARAIAPLGLPADATPEQADAVLEQAASLAGRIKDTRQARARIESLEREVQQFSRDV